MRFLTIPSVVALAALLAFGLTSDAASAAPQGLPDRPIDLELKGADVKNVFRLLAEVSAKNVVLDPCVHGEVDLRLKNAPLPLVYDALGMKLGLVYDEENGAIMVRCAGDAGPSSAKAKARISLSEKDAPLPDVLDRLAAAAKLEGVDYRATTKPKVDVKLEGVRVSTAMTALADTSGLKIAIVKDRLVVSD